MTQGNNFQSIEQMLCNHPLEIIERTAVSCSGLQQAWSRCQMRPTLIGSAQVGFRAYHPDHSALQDSKIFLLLDGSRHGSRFILENPELKFVVVWILSKGILRRNLVARKFQNQVLDTSLEIKRTEHSRVWFWLSLIETFMRHRKVYLLNSGCPGIWSNFQDIWELHREILFGKKKKKQESTLM